MIGQNVRIGAYSALLWCFRTSEFFSPLKTKQICNGVISVSVHDNENNLIFRYVHGLYAFGLEECGEYGPASDHARLALEVNPGDAWAAHAQAHCYEVSVVLTSFFWLASSNFSMIIWENLFRRKKIKNFPTFFCKLLSHIVCWSHTGARGVV